MRPRRGALLGLVHGLAVFLPLLSLAHGDRSRRLARGRPARGAFLAATGGAARRRARGCAAGRSGWPASGSRRRPPATALPFGGFPWGRLAFAETASPFTAVAALGGAPLVTFVTALCGALLAAASWPRRAAGAAAAGPLRRRRSPPLRSPSRCSACWCPPGRGRGDRSRWRWCRATCPASGWTSSASGSRSCATTSTPPTGSRPTSRAGRTPAPDLVVWPENASDIDPFTRPVGRRLIDARRPRRRRAGPRRRRGRRAGPGPREQHRHRLGPGDRAGGALRQAAPGAVRRVHPVPRPAQRAGSRGSTRSPATSTPATGPATSTSARRGSATSSASRSPTTGWCATWSAAAPRCSSCRPTTRPTTAPASRSSRWRCPGCGPSSTAATVLVAATSGISAVVAPDGTVVGRHRSVSRGPWSPTVRAARRATLATRLGAGRSGCWPRPGWRSPVARPRAAVGGAGPAATAGGAAVTRGGRAAAGRAGPASLVVIPTYDERRTSSRSSAGSRAAVPAAARAGRRRRQPGRHRRARRPAGGRGRPRCTCCTGRQAGPRRRRTWPVSAGASPAGYDVLVEMDADGSHQPEQLPALLAALRRRRPGPGLPLGARRLGRQLAAVAGSCSRRGGNTYVRLALGIGLRDATGGFRAFRRATLEKLDLDDVASQGYCFQVDLAWRAVPQGCRVVEVPIEFVEREPGESKMSGAIVARGALAGDRVGPGQATAAVGCAACAPGGGDGWAVLLVVLFLVVPIVEIYVIVQVGQQIGAAPTIVLLLLRERARRLAGQARGPARAWAALRTAAATGRLPSRELADAGAGAGRRHPAAHAGLRHRRGRLLPDPAARPGRWPARRSAGSWPGGQSGRSAGGPAGRPAPGARRAGAGRAGRGRVVPRRGGAGHGRPGRSPGRTGPGRATGG